MNVLFLTLSIMENINERGIYTDLVKELARRGINMHVVFPRERRTGLPTELTINENIKFLKVKTGNITETNFMEKGISTLKIESQYLKAVKRYFTGVRFDLILYSTPPITFEKVVKYFKKEHNSKTYLVLKDIFPQNAVDISILKNGSLIWRYFRLKEKNLYKVSDIIGCMSQGNINYVLNHNPFIERSKVEIFPNSIKPVERVAGTNLNNVLYEKYNLPIDSTLFVYGGNLGKPQGIDFLLNIVDHFHEVNNGHLLIVGSGTEYEKIRNHLDTVKPQNVSLYKKMPKSEYDQLLELADVGLIFLDNRFTIPNFPSRLTAYMEYSLPVLAATDKNTDFKDILKESRSGLWSESGDLKAFIDNAKILSNDKRLRNQMGMNGREYLEEHYDIRKTVNIIIKHL
ncbi:glycosyltransferase family 4 protein [Neobacillus niacini]|uniref:glycosyltransferase family 4 protein n=1 Tax=Neobacillus niacini TaxID=86668 RepID=UPI002FFF61E8